MCLRWHVRIDRLGPLEDRRKYGSGELITSQAVARDLLRP